MQTAYSFFELPIDKPKVTRQVGFRITERDLDMLEFLLEMKFATIEDIHSQFFKVTKIGQESSCLRFARERVANLVRSEMVRVIKDVCHRALYVATQKGYLYLRNSRTDKNYSRPLLSVDGRTYDHDQKIIQLRTVFENNGLSKSWTSERQLSEIEEYRKYLPTEFRPDAIYETLEGKKVAFELEIARKSKERYQQKVKRYIHIMTATTGSERLFDEVHYVCEKETVLNLIRDHTQLFQSLFHFNLLNDFLN